MALPIYLAMTPWEFHNCQRPERTGWLGCHFSSTGSGLSGIPDSLPENSILIADDRIPWQDHDPAVIAHQLASAAVDLSVKAVILDFQRPDYAGIIDLLDILNSSLCCPTGVSALYAQYWDGSVFVPPVPPDTPIQEHLKPWNGRDIWLELDRGGLILTLTGKGCNVQSSAVAYHDDMFYDTALNCHYSIQTQPQKAVFSFTRTNEDIKQLLLQAEEFGVTLAAGLYQELFYSDTSRHKLL